MKKLRFLPFYAMLVIVAMIAATSCTKEGPAGPAGANGTNGVDGKDGEDGIDGQDGTATCIQCHDNTQAMFAKINQWEHSTHATGGNYDRNTEACAPCHTSQGFLERMAAGTMETETAISDPNPVNCYTCHSIHATYTPDDYALTYTDPVDFWHTGGKAVQADWGTGNLCANCHQSRVVSPWPVVGSSDIYTITSYRYGPHHGPQAQLLGGFGGVEIPGTYSYSNSPHTNTSNGCVTCHMAEAAGSESGGHTMGMNYSGCTECHEETTTALTAATVAMMAEVQQWLDTLHYVLEELNIADAEGYLLGDDGVNRASSDNPAKLTADEAAAFFNYKFIEEDKSGGVHNYKYARALLNNSFDAIAK